MALEYAACPNGPCVGLTGPLQFVCEATSGYFCCIGIADSIPIRAGTYAGPFRQGLDQRFANDTDTRQGICFSDYSGNGSRLANVPLIHSFGLGTTKVQVTAFQRMFLVSPPASNASIIVEFVDGPTPARAATWGLVKIRYR